MSVSKNLIESTTKIVATVNGTNFCVNGKTIIQDGFSSHLKAFSKKQNKEEVLPITFLLPIAGVSPFSDTVMVAAKLLKFGIIFIHLHASL